MPISYQPNELARTENPSEGGHFTTPLEAELATADSAAAKALLAQLAAEQAQADAETAEAGAQSSETDASTFADQAQTSANAAAVSETNASTSESNANTYSLNSASSASAAATSETNAATSESNAATSEANAATSESNAFISETNAAASESTVLSSEANVVSLYDTFDDRFLGSKASDPTMDNDGDPLVAGTQYWNTTLEVIRVWNGTIWIDNASGHLHESLDIRSTGAPDGYFLRTDGAGGAAWSSSDGVHIQVQDTPPLNPTQGEEWEDTSTGIKYTWVDDGDSESWVEFGPGGAGPVGDAGITVSDTAPVNPQIDQLWVDSSTF